MSNQRVAVIGGGVAGLSAALDLADRGVSVLLVERERKLGGNALTVCCKAVGGICQHCGACILADTVAAAKNCQALQILTGTSLIDVARDDQTTSLSLAGDWGMRRMEAAAVILATGFDHVDLRTKGPYGYGLVPAVITGEEMERRIRDEGQGAYDGLSPKRIAFIQCVGSRDEHAGRGYCSQVCCRYALRLARLLKSRFAEAEITVFKMDIQAWGRDFLPTYEAARAEGIRFVAGLPAVIRRAQGDPSKAEFLYDDILAGTIACGDYDLVILSGGMQPRADASGLAEAFGINLDDYGFLATAADGVSTISQGVFVAGSCSAPRSIAESVAHARLTAEACYRFLQEGRP